VSAHPGKQLERLLSICLLALCLGALRLGDYRVLFTLQDGVMRIFGVRHRSKAYR